MRRSLLTVLVSAVLAGAPAFGEETLSASKFIDSVCFNTHSDYAGTPYNRDPARAIADLSRVSPRLTIREGYNGGADQEDFYQRAHRQGGHRTLLIMDPGAKRPLTTLMARIQNGAVPGLRALEGPNEFNQRVNDSWIYAQPPRWQYVTLQDFIRRLVSLRDSMDLDVPVYDWSPTNWQAAYEARDAATVDGSRPGVDAGNVHWYSAGANIAPGSQNTDSGWTSGIETNRNFFVRDVHGAGFPFVVTEIGYHTSLTVPGRDVAPLAGHHGVPERVQSAYLINSLLESFWFQAHDNPDPLTCLYELYDEWPHDHPEANFGIYRVDGTAKPARGHINRLLAALRTVGTRDVPVKFTYELDGPHGSPGWHHFRFFSMRRGDGRKVVAVWRPDTIWDRESYQQIPIAPKLARLSLDVEHDVDVINPRVSARPLRTCRGSAIEWNAPADDVTLFVVGSRRSQDPGAC